MIINKKKSRKKRDDHKYCVFRTATIVWVILVSITRCRKLMNPRYSYLLSSANSSCTSRYKPTSYQQHHSRQKYYSTVTSDYSSSSTYLGLKKPVTRNNHSSHTLSHPYSVLGGTRIDQYISHLLLPSIHAPSRRRPLMMEMLTREGYMCLDCAGPAIRYPPLILLRSLFELPHSLWVRRGRLRPCHTGRESELEIQDKT